MKTIGQWRCVVDYPTIRYYLVTLETGEQTFVLTVNNLYSNAEDTIVTDEKTIKWLQTLV